MSLIIPTRSLPAYSFEISLEGTVYRFAIRWNSRNEFWTLDIQNRAGDDLIRGIKLIINYEILKRYRSDILPPGALLPIDTTERLSRIGRDDLGTNVKLIYITKDELDAL